MLAEQGDIAQNAHLAVQGNNKTRANKKGNGKLPTQASIKKESKCFFCKKKGHVKKDCENFAIWLEKKGTFIGNPTSLVSFESNLADVNHDT